MPVYFCTADGTGPLVPVDWTTLPAAVRAACPSHVLRSGRGPVLGSPITHGPDATAELIASGEIDANGILTHPSLMLGATQLRCPECLAPVHVADSAPVWVPPVVEEEPAQAPTVSFKTPVSILPSQVRITSPQWVEIGCIVTAVAGLGVDLARVLGAIVGSVKVEFGALELRLMETDLATGDDRELVFVRVESTGEKFRYVQSATSIGAPLPGPCDYRLEGRVDGALEGWVRGISLALYEVGP